MGRPKGSTNKSKDGNVLRNSVDDAELRRFIERVELVNADIADVQLDRRELYKEIKAAGYDTATIRTVVKRRAMDADKRRTQDERLELYASALGDFASTPLGQAGAERLRGAEHPAMTGHLDSVQAGADQDGPAA